MAALKRTLPFVLAAFVAIPGCGSSRQSSTRTSPRRTGAESSATGKAAATGGATAGGSTPAKSGALTLARGHRRAGEIVITGSGTPRTYGPFGRRANRYTVRYEQTQAVPLSAAAEPGRVANTIATLVSASGAQVLGLGICRSAFLRLAAHASALTGVRTCPKAGAPPSFMELWTQTRPRLQSP
jgi:hypothetical protein